MILYERVSELAKKQGISVFELADKLKLSRNSIYSWKKSSPKAETLEKVADYFHTTTDYLLGRTDDPNRYDEGGHRIPTAAEDFGDLEFNDENDQIDVQVSGLFRSVASKENLSLTEEQELKDELSWYLKERARLIKEKNKRGK